MWYRYLAMMMWLALAYYVGRVASIKLAQWRRREKGEVHPLAELLLGKIFGMKAVDDSQKGDVFWLKRQVFACFGLIALSGGIMIGDIGHFILSSLANQLAANGDVDPNTGQAIQPLTAGEELKLWTGCALIGALITTVICGLLFAVVKMVFWYFQYEKVNLFGRNELDAWLKAKHIVRSNTSQG